jgi:hypothetical protein
MEFKANRDACNIFLNSLYSLHNCSINPPFCKTSKMREISKGDFHMADVSAIFGSLLIFGIAFPGMLAAWWLLFPATVERARIRLDQTPWQCFWFGGILTAATVIPVVILLLLPFGPAKFFGWTLIMVVLSISSLGSAGITAKMSTLLVKKSTASPAAAFVGSAIALELAIIFPLLGWFMVFPLTLVTALGATGFALLRWVPKAAPAPIPAEPASMQAS